MIETKTGDVVCMDHKTVLKTSEYNAMAHALGLTPRYSSRGRFGRRWAYRNYFSAGGEDIALWDGLVDRGLARRIGELVIYQSIDIVFEVTHKGMTVIDAMQYIPRSVLDAMSSDED